MKLQDDMPVIPIVNIKNHYILVFELTPLQDASENCLHPELVGEPLRLELMFTFPLKNVTELFVSVNDFLQLQLIQLVFSKRTAQKDNDSLQ